MDSVFFFGGLFFFHQGGVPLTGSPQEKKLFSRAPEMDGDNFSACRIRYCWACQQFCTWRFPSLFPALLPIFLGPALFWIHLVACLAGMLGSLPTPQGRRVPRASFGMACLVWGTDYLRRLLLLLLPLLLCHVVIQETLFTKCPTNATSITKMLQPNRATLASSPGSVAIMILHVDVVNGFGLGLGLGCFGGALSWKRNRNS